MQQNKACYTLFSHIIPGSSPEGAIILNIVFIIQVHVFVFLRHTRISVTWSIIFSKFLLVAPYHKFPTAAVFLIRCYVTEVDLF